MSGDVDFTREFEPPPPPPKPLSKEERRKRSLRMNIIVSLVISLIIFGGGLLFVYPWGAGTDPVEETVAIPQGTDHQWEIETKGDAIYYSVEVVSGGNVDVIAAKFAYQDGELGYFYLSELMNSEARSAAAEALRYRSVDGLAWAVLAGSLVPRPLLRAMRRIKIGLS